MINQPTAVEHHPASRRFLFIRRIKLVLDYLTSYNYDPSGNLIKSVDPLGNVSTATYDANGRKTSATDANGNVTRFETNAQGQVLKSIDALDNITTYAYGGSGCPSCGGGGGEKLSSLTDANGQTTIFEYDQLGRLEKETDPLGNATSYAYDAKGNLTAKTDANGNTIRYSYDVLGRLTKKVYPDSSEENFSYDAKGNILSAANSSASYTFIYDAGGRTTSVSDGSGRVLRYEYDGAGRKKQTTYPDGSLVSQSYDSSGRLSEIRNGGGRVYRYGYDTAGRRSSVTFPNGVVTSYSYDQAGRLTNLTHKNASGSVLAGNDYTLDKAGNRLTNKIPERALSYQYDAIYRLTEALSSTPGNSSNTSGKGKGIPTATQQQKEFYSYDPVGNRLSSEKTPFYSYNAANQLLSNGGSYRYDKNGNLIEKTTNEGSTTYVWDYENRLVKETLPSGTNVEFKYDPLGRRIEKISTESGVTTTTRYVYDNEDIILEYDGSGSIGNKYVHGPGIDEPLALTQGKETYFYHADGLGSIVALTDKSGKVVQDYQYDSFGNLKDLKNRIKQPYAYTGREYDRETGMYYYRARYYDAAAGRFTQKDPIGFKGGINQYLYVSSNPINYTDPFGLEKVDFDCFKDCWNKCIDRNYGGSFQTAYQLSAFSMLSYANIIQEFYNNFVGISAKDIIKSKALSGSFNNGNIVEKIAAAEKGASDAARLTTLSNTLSALSKYANLLNALTTGYVVGAGAYCTGCCL